MPAQVKILIEGYTTADAGSKGGPEKTQPTIILVTDENIKIIVDPGVLDSQEVLIEKLNKEGLSVNDINYVFITHSHIDHYRNVGMFANAKVIEYFGIWDKNINYDRQENLTNNIKILLTPGHDYTCLTLFAKTTQGVVAICGDVFWKENYPEVDPYAQDLKKLDQSRKMVQDMADFIIPGHGAMYKVKKTAYNTQQILMNNSNNNSNNNYVKNIFPENFIKIIKNKLTFRKASSCKKCRKVFTKIGERCICQPHICYRCCECDVDCELCNCKHKKYKSLN